MRILIVEDEPKLAQALKQGLEAEHYEVRVAATGEDGFFLVNTEVFDLMLPGRDGFEALAALRGRGLQTPVLIISARDAVEDLIRALDSGADGYLVKPFAFPELLARIRALIRRGRADQVLRLRVANLEMDLVTRKVSRDDQMLDLTAREYELLKYARGATSEAPPYEARESGFFSVKTPHGVSLRILQREVEADGLRAVVRAAFDEEQIERELASLLWVLALGLPLAVGAAGLAGYWLAGRALAPVTQITEEARAITADRLDARLPVLNPQDELGRLSTTFNDMFGHLENSFEQLRRFTSDASHELRTPLTVIRSVGEVALHKPHDATAYRDIIGTMLEESDRLAQLVQNLLTLARSDSGRITLKREMFDLGELAGEAANHLSVLAEEKGQQLDVAVTPLPVVGDPAVLRQAVVNVLDNAIKYSPPVGTIQILVEARGREAVLEIADCGPGIAAEHRDRVFDRFYRIDASRNRAEGGFGLGLAIARWAVEANGGRLEADGRTG